MTAPAVAASRFCHACLLGIGLGLWYDFLRPLRHRHPWLGDGILLLGIGWVWLILGFGICDGDLRLGYDSGLLWGGLLWEWAVGRHLRRFFPGFGRKSEKYGI